MSNELAKQDTPASGDSETRDFIRDIVAEDVDKGTYYGKVITRFPPEPNGFLHIGHAKSISLNFGIAADHEGGRCHLRFDDTNPETEDMKYVEAMKRDIDWLGFDWGEHQYFASDYFQQLYDFAEELIEQGKAYVDSLSEEEIREYRGTVMEAGRASPYRDRSIEENLALFRAMRAGEYPDGAHVLRAIGDMSSANMKLRDPLLYRIRHASHYRTGDTWCIYPMYDFAHPVSDAIEHITHSVCTLEFENNRAIYDWLMDALFEEPRPHQYEFARLALDYTLMSKRKLLQLVEDDHVSGWDDPRMPTIAGMRRRGVTPEAIRTFSERIGVAKVNSRIDIALLEHIIRDDLNFRSPRVMCVLRPLKIVIDNYPEDQVEWFDASHWPRDVPREDSRKVPFSRELLIEQDDFREDAPKKFYRLAPGREVRLRYGYVIRCNDVIKDETGAIIELHCTYDPDTLNANPTDRKVKGTIHWVSAAQALSVEVRLYDRLFSKANPEDTEAGETFLDYLNPHSLEVLFGSKIEPSVAEGPPETRYQFERQGYFTQDSVDSRPDALVFNRIIALRDSWSKRAEPERSNAAKISTADAPDTEPMVGSRSDARAEARQADPQLQAAYDRYLADLGLSEQDADMLTGDRATMEFYEAAMAAQGEPQSLARWMNNALQGELSDRSMTDLTFTATDFAALTQLVDTGTISSNAGKEVLAVMVQQGGDPAEIVDARGLRQISDTAALEPIVEAVIAANPDKAAAYRSGKTGLSGFFVGQVMRQTQGKADPKLVKEMVIQKLEIAE